MSSRGIELVNVAPYIKTKTKLKDLADRAKVPTEGAGRLITEMLHERDNHKRQPRPPVPEGGISLSEAHRKYNIPHPTLSRWTKRGYIPVLLRTNRELYIDEAELVKVVELYLAAPGQGKYTIRQKLNDS